MQIAGQKIFDDVNFDLRYTQKGLLSVVFGLLVKLFKKTLLMLKLAKRYKLQFDFTGLDFRNAQRHFLLVNLNFSLNHFFHLIHGHMKKFIWSNGRLHTGSAFAVALCLSLSFFSVNEAQAQVPTDQASLTINGTTGKSSYMVVPASATFLDSNDAIAALKTGVNSITSAQVSSAQDEAYAGAQVEYFSHMLERLSAGASPEEAYLNSYSALHTATVRFNESLTLDMNLVRQNLLSLITQ